MSERCTLACGLGEAAGVSEALLCYLQGLLLPLLPKPLPWRTQDVCGVFLTLNSYTRRKSNAVTPTLVFFSLFKVSVK